jgi:hypothetical protein
MGKMNGCGLAGFDLGKCIGGYAAGWVPDWLVPLIPYWPLAAVIVGAGVAYRLAGAPGLAAFAAAVGFILGRRSVTTEHQYPHPDEKPAPKPKKGLWKK